MRNHRPSQSQTRTQSLRHLSRHALLLLALLTLCETPEPLSQPAEAAAEVSVEPTPGASHAGEVSGGEARTFSFQLRAGQYLLLSLRKGDLNLSLAVEDPAGRRLSEQPSRRYEELEVALLAESGGVYKLEVLSLEREPSARPFEVRVERVGALTPRERLDGEGRRAFAEAARLRETWEEASLRRAAVKYSEAHSAWERAGDPRRAATASAGAAELHFTLGEYRQALSLYGRAAVEFRRGGDGLGEAVALGEVGRLSSYVGDNDAAQRILKQALAYCEEGGGEPPYRLDDARAELMTNMGEVFYAKGDLVNASRHLKRALELSGGLGDRRGEAEARRYIGYVASTLSEQEQARTEFERALALYRAVGDRNGEGRSLTALGALRTLKEQYQAAIGLHLEARDIFRAVGDRQSEAITLLGVGQAYESADPKLSLRNYQSALRLFQSNGSLDFASVAHYQLAQVYHAMHDDARALAHYERCAALSHEAGKRRMEAYAMSDIVAVYASKRERPQALAQFEKVLKFHAETGDLRGQATTLNARGTFYASLGEQENALASYRLALPLSRESGDRGLEISTLYEVARAERDGGDLEGALSHVEEAVEIIEGTRANVGSADLRADYFAVLRKHYDLYIDLLMRFEGLRPGGGYAAAALLASEKARARSLVEILTEAGAHVGKQTDPALRERERELQRMLAAQAHYQWEVPGGKQDDAEEVARQLDELKTEYEVVESRIREQNPHFASIEQHKPLGLEEVQAELRGGDTLLLEYAFGDERSYLWAVTADSLSGHELPPRAELEDATREVYALLTARQPPDEEVDPDNDPDYAARVERADRQYAESTMKLSKMLLGPVAGILAGKRLLIVTEGVLQYIPFDALPAPAEPATASSEGGPGVEGPEPLVAHHEIVYLPSISTLAAIRRQKSRAPLPGRVVVVLADPVFSVGDERAGPVVPDTPANARPPEPGGPPSVRALDEFHGRGRARGFRSLPNTSHEADAIAAAAPPGTAIVVKGLDASRETALSPLLGQYSIVHFATHGLVNSEHPELSGILLSTVDGGGASKDGFLQLYDIYNLDLSADLVVLSACDTALGKDVRGEGLVGLTRGFMHAGSKGVVASLWQVDDRATAELMGFFYKAMLQDGMTPAAALRFAKNEFRRKHPGSSPYYWAAFVLQGEYEGRIEVAGGRLSPALVLGAVVTVVMSATGLYLLGRRRRLRWLGWAARVGRRARRSDGVEW